MSTALGVLTFCHLGYLKDKDNTFPKTCTDGLKRTIIRNMRQINLNTFPDIIEKCRQRMHSVLALKKKF